jgi:methylated-DNA-protein-cysteine methyltransferase related protein
MRHARQRQTRSAAKRASGGAAHARPSADDRAQRIYAVVRAIPRGKVATYGQLALLAGIPAGHRVAARALAQCPDGLAWYRVLAKKDARRAKIAVADPDHARIQRARLAREGVSFDENGYIVLRQFGWLPSEAPSQKRAKHVASAPEKRKNR